MNEALKRYNDLRFAYLHNLSVLHQNLVEGNWDKTLDEEEDRITSASIGRESHNPRWFIKSLESLVRDTQNRIANLKGIWQEMDELVQGTEARDSEQEQN